MHRGRLVRHRLNRLADFVRIPFELDISATMLLIDVRRRIWLRTLLRDSETNMRRMILAILAVCLLASFATTSYGCYCGMPDVTEAFEESEVIFLGEVAEIIEPLTSDPDAPLPKRFFTIKFKVEKSWKGVSFFATEFAVFSAQNRDNCFAYPPVHKGERYLVYANVPRSLATKEAGWPTLTGCGNRTSLVEFKPRGPNEIDPYHDMKQLDLLAFEILKPRPRVSPEWTYPWTLNSGLIITNQSSAIQTDPNERVYTADEVDVKAKVKNKLEHLPERKNDCPDPVETTLRVVLHKSGKVTEVVVIKRAGCSYDQEAIKAARWLKFIPAMKYGVPVSQYSEIVYETRTAMTAMLTRERR